MSTITAFIRRSAPPLGLASVAAAGCQGRGEPALELVAGIGEGLAVAAMLVALATLLIYLGVWGIFVATWRRGAPSRVVALLLTGAHGAVAIGLGAEEDPAAPWILATAVLPALAVGVSLRRGRWVTLGVAAAIVAALALATALQPRELRELPSPIVEVAAAFTHACARLDDGAVICTGSDADGQRGDGAGDDFAISSVADLDDATAITAALGLTCALRADAPPVCWGGATLPAPGDPTRPWPLPGAAAGTLALALTPAQILALGPDHSLHGWPRSLPPGLSQARHIAAEPGSHGALAAIDLEGTLWIWEQRDPPIEGLHQLPGFAGAIALARGDDGHACVLLGDGAVECVDAADDLRGGAGELTRTRSPELRADQLVALDDPFDTFCARQRDGLVLCWAAGSPPQSPPDMAMATALRSTATALCDARPAGVRCVPISETWGLDSELERLLALPVRR